MKKMIIPMLAAFILLLPAYAALAVTADEVEEMYFTTGIQNYPEFGNMLVVDSYGELMPGVSIGDIVDINRTLREFSCTEDGSGRYIIDRNGEYLNFYGIDRDGYLVSVMPVSGILRCERMGEYKEFKNKDDGEYGWLNFSMIAESINAAGVGEAEEICCFCGQVYVKTDSGEYVLSTKEMPDVNAERMGREDVSIHKWQLMDVNEYFYTKMKIEFSPDSGIIKADRMIVGDEPRKTDTLAPYRWLTESRYSDVGAELTPYVEEIAELNVLSGWEDGTFRPDEAVTRAYAAQVVAELFRLKEDRLYIPVFYDVNADHWFAEAVSALYKNNIVAGDGEGYFYPNKYITYQEFFKIVTYALGYGVPVRQMGGDSMLMAMNLGLSDGLPTVAGNERLTRGDMAIILSNALDTPLMVTNTFGLVGKSEGDITLIDYLSGRKPNGVLEY
ncbi:MAG: S-layer homology domain-containing protein [Oscillospiraceae bacterium]|nr:S-layer homology domain-containing protein [Oscillospiraceae bacterium]